VSNTKKAAPRTIEDVMAMATPRETEVRICVAGDLAPEAERLAAELDALGPFAPTSLSEADPRTALQGRLDAVYDKMRESEVVFRFRALGKLAYSDLLAAHPARPDEDGVWNAETFGPALISACCVEPAMSVEQVGALSELLSQSQRNVLFNGAWSAQVGETRVPISRAASTSP
jgi:hypothetical protein